MEITDKQPESVSNVACLKPNSSSSFVIFFSASTTDVEFEASTIKMLRLDPHNQANEWSGKRKPAQPRSPGQPNETERLSGSESDSRYLAFNDQGGWRKAYGWLWNVER